MTLVDSASQGGMGGGGGVGQGGPPDELSTLWSLVAELSSQLTANRELCVSLQQQAEHLKGQVHHNNNGYALRRFNVDVSKEKFESELERINVQLVKENTQLQYENKQLNALLREHEQTIEAVMIKFRNFSVSRISLEAGD
jgi:SIKE family